MELIHINIFFFRKERVKMREKEGKLLKKANVEEKTHLELIHTVTEFSSYMFTQRSYRRQMLLLDTFIIRLLAGS